MWKVPIYNTAFDEKEPEIVQRIIRSGWLTMGEMTDRFEKSFAEFIGVRHAIAVSSGTAALHLANLALGVSGGNEVICPSLTFVAGANSIIYAGARPVFADISGSDNVNISPEDIESNITDNTRAIQVVHYAGFPCDMESIIRIADKYGLAVIEDCAHSLGAEYNGKMCGSIGNIGCFSFFSNKNMTTAEGGMIVTDSDQLAQKLRLMRSHGMTSLTMDRHLGNAFSYDVTSLGFNYRIDEIRSALGIVQLEKLTFSNNKRRELAQSYMEKLEDVSGLNIPFIKNTGLSAHHIFPVLLDNGINRHKFMQYLKDKGIQTSIHYPCIHQFEFYRREFGCKEGMLPVTEDITKREVTLPLYPSMSEESVQYVCKEVAEYLKKGDC